MKTQNNISNAAFLRWMKPILVALKELGGQAKPQEVRSAIAKNEYLTEEELSETRGKTMSINLKMRLLLHEIILFQEGTLIKAFMVSGN